MIPVVKTFKTLIVDDNEVQIKLATRSLKKVFEENHFAYSIDEAPDGERAWDMCQDRKFDLYVIDYQMPGMNGVELCRKILRKHTEAKIVLYSSDSAETIVRDEKSINGEVIDKVIDIIPKEVVKLRDWVERYIQTPSIAKKFADEVQK